MTAPQALIFDLGDTLIHWEDWDGGALRAWAAAYDHLQKRGLGTKLERQPFVAALRAAELAHWQRVETEHWSGPPTGLVAEGFRRLDVHAGEDELLAVLDGYAQAVSGWAEVFTDTVDTLRLLRGRGYRLGLLSNTWWAADWHNADLAAHGLTDLLDEVVYTSDLPHSKPHPSVFRELAERLDSPPAACVMTGDRPIDDIAGALSAGMRGVWKTNGTPRPKPDHIIPTATIRDLSELPALLQDWGGR